MFNRKRELKDEAAQLLRKRKYPKALRLFQEVIRLDPDDRSARRNVGHILRKLDRPDEAADCFAALANEYAEDGFLLKAIATCKVVLEIDPSHKEVQQRLADLYCAHTTSTRPALKVLADEDERGRPCVQALPVQAMGLATDAVELSAAAEPGCFEVACTTPIQHLEAAAPGPDGEGRPAKAGGSAPAHIETVELESITLEPLEAEAGARPGPTEATGAAATAGQAEAGPEEADLEGIEIELEFDFEPEPAKRMCQAPEIPLFCELEPDAFVVLLERLSLVRMKPGEWILREGEPGSSMFTVVSGKVRVLKRLDARRMLRLAVLGEGAFFGEMSLLRGGVRGASVQAVEAGELFEISQELIDEVVAEHPGVEQVLVRFAHQRMLRNAMVTSPLFSPFDRQQRIEIIERFVCRDVEPGQVLITQGREADGLYMVLRGKLDVVCSTDDDRTIRIGHLTEGEIFGEISCLRKEPAIATVEASTAGCVLRLPRKDFDTLVLSHPQILELVDELGEERFARTANALAEKGILI